MFSVGEIDVGLLIYFIEYGNRFAEQAEPYCFDEWLVTPWAFCGPNPEFLCLRARPGIDEFLSRAGHPKRLRNVVRSAHRQDREGYIAVEEFQRDLSDGTVSAGDNNQIARIFERRGKVFLGRLISGL